MKSINRVLAAVIMAFAMIACSEEEKQKIVVQDGMEAEQLAQAGEQLMNGYTFMLADRAFTAALKQDPTNQRAQFYKAFLARLMTLQGVIKRIRPFVSQHGDVSKLDKWSQELPNSALKDFLLAGSEDIHTTTQLQDLMSEYQKALILYYRYLKQNQDLNLVLNMSPYLLSNSINNELIDNCTVTELPDGGFQAVCDYRELFQRKVNSADMIALRQLVAGEILYTLYGTSYSFEGLESHGREYQSRKLAEERLGPITDKEKYEKLDALPEFGKLRANHQLGILRELGADFAGAMKWAIQHQDKLCPPVDHPLKKRRKGYLIADGICIANPTETQKAVALLEQALNGIITVDAKLPDGTLVSTRVDPFVFSRNPVTNLKSLFPASYNECGKSLTLRDKTMGGFYPDANAELFLDTRCTP